MIAELLKAPAALGALSVALLIFGFLPGLVLALIVRLIPDLDRRREIQAELYAVPRWERPFWVAEQFEVALRVGLAPRVEWVWGRYVWHRCRLESGVASHRASPDTFWIPDDEEKAVLREGDRVKLMWSVARFPGERMWVTVTERSGDRLRGTLDNWPVFVYLDPGERVSFHIDNVIDCILEEGDADNGGAEAA